MAGFNLFYSLIMKKGIKFVFLSLLFNIKYSKEFGVWLYRFYKVV